MSWIPVSRGGFCGERAAICLEIVCRVDARQNHIPCTCRTGPQQDRNTGRMYEYFGVRFVSFGLPGRVGVGAWLKRGFRGMFHSIRASRSHIRGTGIFVRFQEFYIHYKDIVDHGHQLLLIDGQDE